MSRVQPWGLSETQWLLADPSGVKDKGCSLARQRERTMLLSLADGPLLPPGRAPPTIPGTHQAPYNQLTSATGTSASASCPIRSFP